MTQQPGIVLKLYIHAQRWMEKLFILLQAGFNGLWLGLLSREALHQYDQLYYDRINFYRDEEYNRSGLFDWEKARLEEYFGTAKSILLTGAGGGREVLALHRLGYIVDGYETNPRLAECANQLLASENIPARVQTCPRDVAPQTGKVYDGIIAGWGMYMLIQGRAQRVTFLRQLRAQCAAGAPVLLSFFTRKDDRFHYRFIPRVGNIFRWLLRRERIEIGDDLTPDFVHSFTRAEVAAELEAAGFEIVHYSEQEYGQAVGLARETADE